MPDDKYRLTVRARVSTLHKDPATERCNLDDTDSDISVDEFTAAAVIDNGDALRCAYCWPGEPG